MLVNVMGEEDFNESLDLGKELQREKKKEEIDKNQQKLHEQTENDGDEDEDFW